jgi:hypothetical protein
MCARRHLERSGAVKGIATTGWGTRSAEVHGGRQLLVARQSLRVNCGRAGARRGTHDGRPRVRPGAACVPRSPLGQRARPTEPAWRPGRRRAAGTRSVARRRGEGSSDEQHSSPQPGTVAFAAQLCVPRRLPSACAQKLVAATPRAARPGSRQPARSSSRWSVDCVTELRPLYAPPRRTFQGTVERPGEILPFRSVAARPGGAGRAWADASRLGRRRGVERLRASTPGADLRRGRARRRGRALTLPSPARDAPAHLVLDRDGCLHADHGRRIRSPGSAVS